MKIEILAKIRALEGVCSETLKEAENFVRLLPDKMQCPQVCYATRCGSITLEWIGKNGRLVFSLEVGGNTFIYGGIASSKECCAILRAALKWKDRLETP